MQRMSIWLVCGTLVVAAGCHKGVPTAANTVPGSPVPTRAAAPTPAPAARQQAAAPRVAQTPPAPRSNTLTPEERETLNQRLAHLSDALFDYDTANIRPDALSMLRSDVEVIRGILAHYPSQQLLIAGSADERGSAEYNLVLGDRRARAAEEVLTNMGIPHSQLRVVSYGKEQQVCSTHEESCWQQNRRAHITAAP